MSELLGPPPAQNQMSDYWRSMGLFNIYRIIIAVVLISSYYVTPDSQWQEHSDKVFYLKCTYGYLTASLLAMMLTWVKWPRFNLLLSLQVIADIVFITLILFASGGIKSGAGLLLVVAIAAASLISRGRLSTFYAALATIAVLLEQSYQILFWNDGYDDYSYPVMLSLSFFATALLANSLARRAQQSEALASKRGIDLENLEQVNRLITQEIQDGVMVVDAELNIRHRNRHVDALLEIDDERADNTSLNLYSPSIADLLAAWMQRQQASETIRTRMGNKELQFRFMPIAENRQQGAVIFIEDWSQVQAQAQRLKLAALGRLTANIAHEIRNPLSAISHATQLLQEEEKDPTTRKLLNITADNVKRLDQIVSDVLQLNRRDRTNQEQIDLQHFLTDFHEQFCQIEQIPPGCFTLHINMPSSQVLFDRRHLHQVLWNICRNGWRHSLQQTKSLNLSLTPNGQHYRVDIQDDGEGIDVEAQAHLFEPFFTTESTGSGLGLYIARELCEANGAVLQYIPVEHGALFSISLRHVQ